MIPDSIVLSLIDLVGKDIPADFKLLALGLVIWILSRTAERAIAKKESGKKRSSAQAGPAPKKKAAPKKVQKRKTPRPGGKSK